jgi:hypothetical protein
MKKRAVATRPAAKGVFPFDIKKGLKKWRGRPGSKRMTRRKKNRPKMFPYPNGEKRIKRRNNSEADRGVYVRVSSVEDGVAK